MHILAISGSLRQGSHNTALLRAAADMLPPGVTVDFDDRLEEIPAFNEDRVATRPEPVDRLWDAVAEADGVLISTPEYNSSIPGVLKNALDWLSRPLIESPLRNKPAAVIGASTSMFGAVWSQAETRKVLGRSAPAFSIASCPWRVRTSSSTRQASWSRRRSSRSSAPSCRRWSTRSRRARQPWPGASVRSPQVASK